MRSNTVIKFMDLFRSVLVAAICCTGAVAASPQKKAEPKTTKPDRVEQLISNSMSDPLLDRELKFNADSIRRITLNSPELTKAGWPRLSEFNKLQSISIRSAKTLSDTGLDFPKPMERLEFLELTSCDKVTGSFLKHGAKWPRLASLFIRSSAFDGQHLIHLRGSRLRHLDIRSPKLRHTHLSAFGELQELEEIRIFNSPQLFALNLSQFPNLREITIRNCGLRSQGFRGLKDHKHLEIVRFIDCKHMRDLNFASLKSLRVLEISNSDTGDKTTSSLSGLERLEVLSLPGCPNITALNLKNMTNLKRLDLSGTKLSPGSLKDVRAASKLERLDLARCGELGKEEARAIAKLPNLKSLDVIKTTLTPAAYKPLTDLKAKGKVRVYIE